MWMILYKLGSDLKDAEVIFVRYVVMKFGSAFNVDVLRNAKRICSVWWAEFYSDSPKIFPLVIQSNSNLGKAVKGFCRCNYSPSVNLKILRSNYICPVKHRQGT